jgi:hypothetical protein
MMLFTVDPNSEEDAPCIPDPDALTLTASAVACSKPALGELERAG